MSISEDRQIDECCLSLRESSASFAERKATLKAAWSARVNRLMCAALLGTAAAVGCRGTSPQFESRPAFPVEGMVLVRGKPAEGVQVFLHPSDPTQRGKPRGVTDAEGRFHLRTYRDGDGAPAGEYTVTVYWPDSSDTKAAVEERLPRDRLGQRFMDPKSSPLRAAVSAAPTTLPPFEIK
ncbi:MAG: hypothetical protein ACLQNE_18135 [Thermoguttaceae bacterium]